MQLSDIYDIRDLDDEEEFLFHHLDEEDLSRDFAVQTLAHDQIAHLLHPDRTSHILELYRDFGDARAQDVVARKMLDFDTDRIVLIRGQVLLDGYHHVVAAHQLGHCVRCLDLDRPCTKGDASE